MHCMSRCSTLQRVETLTLHDRIVYARSQYLRPSIPPHLRACGIDLIYMYISFHFTPRFCFVPLLPVVSYLCRLNVVCCRSDKCSFWIVIIVPGSSKFPV